jgi:hypothetical protein
VRLLQRDGFLSGGFPVYKLACYAQAISGTAYTQLFDPVLRALVHNVYAKIFEGRGNLCWPRAELFTDTEAREDAAQQIVSAEFAGDAAQNLLGHPQVLCE